VGDGVGRNDQHRHTDHMSKLRATLRQSAVVGAHLDLSVTQTAKRVSVSECFMKGDNVA
jgi:hypothetical protein